MNIATNSVSGVIPVPSCNSRHYYADVFGVAYGFPFREDRDDFVAYAPPARVLAGNKVNANCKLSRYPFVVVCRSFGRAVRLYRGPWMLLTVGRIMERNLS